MDGRGPRLLSVALTFLCVHCMLACDLQWRTVRAGSLFNPDKDWVLMPAFGSAVARWKSVVPGKVDSENSTAVGYFCDIGDEAKPPVFEVLQDLSIDKDGCKLEWVRLYDMDRFQLQPLFANASSTGLLSFCLVPAKFHNNTAVFARCDVQSNTARYCVDGREFVVDTLPNTTVVLTVRAVKRREVIITSAADITNDMVTRRPESVITRTFRNFGGSEGIFRIEAGYDQTTESAYSEDYGWRLVLGADYVASTLNEAIAQWRTTFAGEGHGNYNTERRQSERTSVTLGDEYRAEPHSKTTVIITILREVLQVPYEAEEVFYDAMGRTVGTAQIRGVWRGVNTFRGQTDLYQTFLLLRNETTQSSRITL